MVPAIPRISEQDVKRLCGEQSLDRGRHYVNNGSLYSTRREGLTLTASCHGSRATSYRLEVTFNGHGLKSSRCSCPVGTGGHCKHIAALLLAWIGRPTEFKKRAPLQQTLDAQSKTELIALITYLLRLEPDLEAMIESRLASTKGNRASTDPTPYEQQAAMLFERNIHRQGTESALAEELLTIKTVGDEMAVSQNFNTAIAVYAGVARSVAAKLGEYQYIDNEGHVDEVVMDCVNGLVDCLRHETSTENRSQAVEALIWVYIQDASTLGGIGLSDGVPNMVQYLTPEDKQLAKALLESAVNQDGDSWAVEQYTHLLTEIDSQFTS